MKANRSISEVPLTWQIFWNDWGASFYSEVSELFLDSQSAVIFILLGRYFPVRVIPHWRRWSHISFANWTNFKLCVPSIFNRYVKATMLSPWRWMALCSKVFENVYITSFMAKSSETFMWFFISWADHIPPVEAPLHVAPQPFVEASVCINTSAGGWINAGPLHSSKFCTHHFSSIFQFSFKTILSK